MNGICVCDGDVLEVSQNFPDAVYHAAGTTSPTEDAQTACNEALSIIRAKGIDPCTLSDSDLQAAFNAALQDVQSTVASEPVFNNLQKWFDQTIGTASPNVGTVPPKPPAQQNNTLLLVGFIAVVAIGFFLVFR